MRRSRSRPARRSRSGRPRNSRTRFDGSARAVAHETVAAARPVDRFVRIAFRVFYLLARAYWTVRQPRHRGALVAIWADGRLLLVRQSYQPHATLPGGGVKSGEAPRQAATRELLEELGLRVEPDQLMAAFEATELWDGRQDTVSFFELHLSAEPPLRLDGREIVSARFVQPSELPGTSPQAARYLRWWRQASKSDASRAA